MFNIFVTILLFIFLPGLLKGDIASGVNKISNKIIIKQEQKVLGAEKEQKIEDKKIFEIKSEEGQKNSALPQSLHSSGLLPDRKKNCVDLKLWAGSSVSIDVDSGTILHYDEGRRQTQIASLTKIMTAILVMDNVKNFNEEVRITKEALTVLGTVVGCPTSVFCNGNRMYVGEKVAIEDLLKAMLLNSANDAATALAIHISGTEEKFVEKMNQKVKDMGLIDTHFCTSSGLEIDGKENECYSSAYDIARIGAASMKYKLIWDIMKISEGQFYSTDGKYTHLLKNTDLLLGNISNCLGGKTGFTPLAGKSLLMGSTDATGKHKIISVLLNDENRWDDMKLLVNWINNNYEWK